MGIFHSYVSLPEGIWYDIAIEIGKGKVMMIIQLILRNAVLGMIVGGDL